jgi:hemoglobin-like flavoprotein
METGMNDLGRNLNKKIQKKEKQMKSLQNSAYDYTKHEQNNDIERFVKRISEMKKWNNF